MIGMYVRLLRVTSIAPETVINRYEETAPLVDPHILPVSGLRNICIIACTDKLQWCDG